MKRWPFDEWLKLAVQIFRLSPDQFWDCSLRDWMKLIQAESVRLDRSGLDTLLKLFPDEEEDNDR